MDLYDNEIVAAIVPWYRSIWCVLLIVFLKFVRNRYIKKIVQKIVAKTKNKYDDYIIRAFSPPVEVILCIAVFYGAVYFAPLRNYYVFMLAEKVLRCSIIICVFWAMFRLATSRDKVGFVHEIFKTMALEHNNTIANIFSAVIRIVIVLIGICVISKEFGFDITAFIASLSIGTAAIAFAAKDLFANVFASIVILMDKPFKEGDWIITDNIEGIVEKITFRSTCIKTFTNEIVYIPSSLLTNGPIHNLAVWKTRRILLTISLALDTKTEQVKKVIDEIKGFLENEKVISNDKPVRVYLKQCTKVSYDIEIVCYTAMLSQNDYVNVVSLVNLAITEMLQKREVKLAFFFDKFREL